MSNLTTYVKCGRCLGIGIDNNERDIDGNVISESCTACGGTGYVSSGAIDATEIIDTLNWIKKKIQKILHKLDIPEDED